MRYLKQVLALTVTAVFLYLAFRGVDFRQAMTVLDASRVRPLPLVLFSFLSLAVMWLRAWRWKYFFTAAQGARIWPLTEANLVGFAFNTVLPFRMGEMVRALMGRRKVPGASLSYVLAGLFIERVFDTLCLMLCLILPLALDLSLPSLVRKVAQVMVGAFAGATLLLVVMRLKPEAIMRLVLPILRRLLPDRLEARVERFLRTFTEGVRVLGDAGAVAKITLLSLAHWGAVVLSYQLAFMGFSIEGLHWSAAFVTLGYVGLGVALPSAPAFIGPLHWAIIYALSTIYGVDRSLATGFAVVAHILMMSPVTVVGLLMMWREGLSLGQVCHRAEELAEERVGPEQAGEQQLPEDLARGKRKPNRTQPQE